jgi:hypothetical protein
MNQNLSPLQPKDIKVDREIVLVVSEENDSYILEGICCGHELLNIAKILIDRAQELLVHRLESEAKE